MPAGGGREAQARVEFGRPVTLPAASCPGRQPGQPVTAHRSVPDRSRLEGPDEERLREFARVAQLLTHRIEVVASLPIAKPDRLTPHGKVREIGGQ